MRKVYRYAYANIDAIVAPVDMTLDAVLIADVNVLEVVLPGEATG